MSKRNALAGAMQMPVPSLAKAFESKGILFGFAVNDHRLSGDAAYRDLIAGHAGIIVPENAMKWQALRPAADQFDYTRANTIVDFAQAHQIKIRGHALCWHRAMPEWFEKIVTAENAKALLVEHIQTVVGHYAGKIHSWDVVNEAIRPDDKQPDGMRASFWYKLLGESYIDAAFHAARQADPKALLTYNDYGVEYDNGTDDAHRAAVLALLQRLKARNVPIDAVGMQSHMRTARGERFGDGVTDFIHAVRKLGLKVFITELDVDDSPQPASIAERDDAVADVYSRYLQAVLDTAQVPVVLSWGVQDPASVQSEIKPRSDGAVTRPFLFDPQGQPTAAFSATLKVAKQVPKTRG
jgi:endo-1,4-beta-xylanase